MNSRCQALARALQDAGHDAFMSTARVTNGYLCGLFENAHERLLALVVFASGETELIAPALSESQARRVGIRDVFPWSDGQDPYQLLLSRLSANGRTIRTIAVEPEYPARHLIRLQSSAESIRFVDGEATLAQLRSKKDADELERMRAASRIVDDVFDVVKTQIRVGMTELEVGAMLKQEIESRGGTPTFCIVATGAGSAEPHHITDGTIIELGHMLLLDFGCELNHYQSDVTRMLHLGPATDQERLVYDLVYQAHQAGREAIRPGVTAGEVDFAARSVIETGGFGPQFFHRLGHGIGMEGHEEPNLVAGSDRVLEPGNCFSVEPGIYLQGEFGVRIENLVAVNSGGHESFNREPSATLECI